jgi:hypothetical protein
MARRGVQKPKSTIEHAPELILACHHLLVQGGFRSSISELIFRAHSQSRKAKFLGKPRALEDLLVGLMQVWASQTDEEEPGSLRRGRGAPGKPD